MYFSLESLMGAVGNFGATREMVIMEACWKYFLKEKLF